MHVPLQITMRHMPQSEALEARIREKAAKLDEFHPNVTGCHVTVEEQRRHHQQGHWFNVRVAVRVPSHEIVVNRDHDEDPYVALRDAFDAVDAAARGRRPDAPRRRQGARDPAARRGDR